MNYILGIDAGGTFIDYLLVNDTGKYLSHKTLARPDVSDYGIISGLEELAEYTGYDLPELLARVRLIVHGTTVATNAILTRSGSPTALLTTEGLVDLLEMRQGGNHATCTDADLVLGLINPNYFLGGRLKLNLEAAWDVIYKEVALPLQTNVLSAALGIYRMVNTEMASGIKEITLEKGYDPREMTMVVGGGAGALHAPYVAKELGIRHLLISRESSVMCALGMLYSNYRRDYYRHYYSQVFAFNWQVVQEIYHQLWLHAREQAGDRNNLLIAHKLIYMRYQGQHHELAVEISKLECLDSTELARLFHNHHFNIYGYDLSDLNTPIEIIGLAIVVEDEAYNIPPYKPGSANSGRPTLKGTRRVCLEEPGSYQEIPVYDGDNMPFNSRITGPALVEQRHSTTVVPADFTLLCTGNYFEMKQI